MKDERWILNTPDFCADLPGKYFGFIYKITNLDNGKIYIGRKNFFNRRKKKFGKKRIAAMPDKRAKKYEYVIKESNWLTYNSSCKELKKDIKDGCKIRKEIIHLVERKEQMTYFETKYQFINEVLEIDSYNDNINGRYYRKIFE